MSTCSAMGAARSMAATAPPKASRSADDVRSSKCSLAAWLESKGVG